MKTNSAKDCIGTYAFTAQLGIKLLRFDEKPEEEVIWCWTKNGNDEQERRSKLLATRAGRAYFRVGRTIPIYLDECQMC